MPLSPEQKVEADKLGIPYDAYEASINEMIASLGAALASFNAPGGINTPEGQAALRAGIADNIGNINPLTMLGLEGGPLQNSINLTRADGSRESISTTNPTQDLSSQRRIDNLMKDVVEIDYLDNNTGRTIRDPINPPIKTINVKVVNNSISKGTTHYIINGQRVEEGSTTQFDLAKLNDSTIIFPNYDTSKYTVLNRFIIGKNGDGLVLNEVEGSTSKDTKFFDKIPTTIEVDFKYNTIQNPPSTKTKSRTIVGETTYTVKQDFGFLTNYRQSPFNILVESADLSSPLLLKTDDSATITSDNRELRNVSFSVSNTGNYDLLTLKWAYAGDDNYSSIGFNDGKLTLPSNILIRNINIFVELKPSDSKIAGIQLGSSFNFKVPGSTLRSKFKTTEFNIPLSIKNSESVLVKTPFGERRIGLSSGGGFEGKNIILDVKQDFKNNIGSFKVVIVPTNGAFGDTPNPGYTIINVSETYDVPLINEIDFPDSITIPTYTLGEYPFDIQYRSDTADYVIVYHSSEDQNYIIGKYGKAENLKFNFNDLKRKGALNSSSKINLIFVPYDESNVNGQSVMEAIRGDETKITISVEEPALYISTDKLKKDLFDSIISNFDLNLQDTPKYLNHLAEFDKEDKQIVISNWETDFTTFTNFIIDELGNQIPNIINKSIVLKLYEPLPTTINKNDTLWISKLMSLPIVRRITVTDKSFETFQFLRGPNFDIEVDFVKEQSTSFESLDSLILSDSTTSQQIVNKYLYDNFFETDRVNIDYSNFSNFVKYSSVIERLANFKYKKELIEYYDDRILYLQNFTDAVTAVNEIVNFQTKKVNLLNAFDGWENYLVSSSYSDFPKSDGFAQRFTSGLFNSNGEYSVSYLPSGSAWFNSTLTIAQSFDTNNRNSLKNNIPLHLIDSGDNEQYLLFLDMIGHHFDVIWSYINGMSDTKNITETNEYGIHDEFLYDYLKSFGWDAKNVNSNEQLWKYLFGKNADGVVVQENTAEERTKIIWRRIANNLPYLLKNKGTKRGISALLNCYGIAGSNLSIVEFGGPDSDTTLESTKYIYDTQTANLNFTSDSYLTTKWSGSNAIELRIKPAYSGSGMTLVSGSSFTLSLVPGNNASQTSGSLELSVASTTGVQTVVTNQYQFYDENYHSILLNRETIGTSSKFSFYFKNGEKDRIIKQGTFESVVDGAIWNSGSTIQLGGNYIGEIDEFRLWSTPLDESAFNLHVLHPEAINGNHISSSTTDLQIRLDFEYPKNLGLTSSSVKNVAPNNTYQLAVSASGFVSQSSYPWNYEIIDRTVSLEVPNSGASRYSSNKVRFEDQTLVSDLSYKSRSTLKAFETSKRDSNRLGIFFSPNKDLDLDIAKSFGGISIDDYIGAYDDQYQDTYKDLTNLRNYYFERIGERDIYQFINLVRLYDKSLFVNLKQMLPARVKATTGLLIAPHLLERSKHKIEKPNADISASIGDANIDTTETTLISGDVNIFDTKLSLTSSTTLIGEFNNHTASISLETANTLKVENDTYEGTITDFDINNLVSVDNYFEGNQTASIDTRIISASVTAEFEFLGSTIVNVGELYSDIGYTSYFDNGFTRLNYQDYDGTYKSRKVRGFIVTRRSDLIVPMNVGGISGSIYEDILTDVFKQELIIQEGSQTGSLADDFNIVSITTASGYLKSHYIYNKDRSVGLENTFFRGSKQTIATTIDGRAAIEEFVSNPTILRVNENGRPNNEPILVVD